MSDVEFKEFCCMYQYAGADWGLEIKALDFADAERRLRAIGANGVVDGELMAVIPAQITKPKLAVDNTSSPPASPDGIS